MFITYIIQWWDDCGKAHMLHIDSLDHCVSEVDVEEEEPAIIICSHRLSINKNLSSTDYTDFFEVIYDNGYISKIVFKMGKSRVKIRHEYESVGKRAAYNITTTKVMAGNIPRTTIGDPQTI